MNGPSHSRQMTQECAHEPERRLPGACEVIFMPRTFESYFTYERIVTAIARKRIAASRKTRRDIFFRTASDSSATRKLPELYGLMPPRQHWPRPPKLQRDHGDPSQAHIKSLARYASRVSLDPATRFQWAIELRGFVNAIRHRALNWADGEPYTSIRLKIKPKKGREFRERCRVLSVFSLEDSIISSCFAAYLRDTINPHLEAEALAFRAPIDGRLPVHHDAVPLIEEFRKRSKSSPIWVAECDIKGFYDSIAHASVIAELNRLGQQHNIKFDTRFNAFVRSFLSCNSYTSHTLPLAKSILMERFGVEKPNLHDPIVELAEIDVHSGGEHGIPQGSALSCVLANVILDRADKDVKSDLNGAGLYIRYCDDIIILTTSAKLCNKALQTYLRVLRELKLPYHRPVNIPKYGRAFWKSKSKNPYEWRNGSGDASPWLGYVGYQIRRDGEIRARKDSIIKESVKHRTSISQIFKYLLPRLRKPNLASIPETMSFRTLVHLISFGVGSPSSKFSGPQPDSASWSQGFLALFNTLRDPAIRGLDASRNRALQAQTRHINYLENRQLISQQPSERLRRDIKTKFMGRPFSYAAQFTKFTTESDVLNRTKHILTLRAFRRDIQRILKSPPRN